MKEYIYRIDEELYEEETGRTVFKPKVVGELVRFGGSKMRLKPKPCPFCGGKVNMYDVKFTFTVAFVCEHCGMETHTEAEDVIEAIKKWNTRAEREEDG